VRGRAGGAVEFDDEAVVGPVEVDLDLRVDERLWQTGVNDAGKEVVFGGAAGAGAAGVVELDRVLEDLEVRAAVRAGHRGLDRSRVVAVAEPRLVDHVRELVGGEHVGQVDQRAGDGRDRDPVAGRDVARVRAAPEMHAHPGTDRRRGATTSIPSLPPRQIRKCFAAHT
jgi:hypothetical protein